MEDKVKQPEVVNQYLEVEPAADPVTKIVVQGDTVCNLPLDGKWMVECVLKTYSEVWRGPSRDNRVVIVMKKKEAE